MDSTSEGKGALEWCVVIWEVHFVLPGMNVVTERSQLWMSVVFDTWVQKGSQKGRYPGFIDNITCRCTE